MYINICSTHLLSMHVALFVYFVFLGLQIYNGYVVEVVRLEEITFLLFFLSCTIPIPAYLHILSLKHSVSL